MAVLVLRDIRPSGQPGPGESVEQVEPAVEYQVCLREPNLSRKVLQKVQLGDRLVVLGILQLDVVTGPLEDSLSAARISLDAVAIGIDLGSQLA